MGNGAIVGGWWAYRPRRLLFIIVAVCIVIVYFGYALQDNYNRPIVRNVKQQKQTILHKKFTTKSTTHHPEFKENMTINYNITESNFINNLNVTNSTQQFSVQTIQLITNLTDSNDKENINTTDPVLSLCEAVPPGLGPITANNTELELKFVEKKYPEVHSGGWYTPTNCVPKDKVAIIVPYRDREEHLAMFLNHMHPFLMKQQIQYRIFIIEQEGDTEFNRGKLMNVGYVESQKLVPGGWQCFIFHDIDLLPLDSCNLYSCPDQPRHMSAAIDKFNFKLPYKDIFGGVSAIRTEQFTKVNGFSNKYWGWGGEDDDMYKRLKKNNYCVTRPSMTIARYTMLTHNKSSPNLNRYKLLAQTNKTYQKDGLSSLEYKLVELIQYHLYTYLLVNINEHR